jgi:hypothetical protein
MSVSTPVHPQPNATVPAPPAPSLGLRRAPRHLLFGLALVVAFSLLFALLALRADPATSVLAVSRPVPAGATITDADLAVVRIVPGPGMQVVTEADRGSVVGRTAAVPLTPDSLLAPTQVGPPDWPPDGQSVIAVGVPRGRVPAGLGAGSQVTLLAPSVASEEAETAGTLMVSGSVVEVAAPDVSGAVVVSLLLTTGDAHRVAAADSDVSLVLESPGRSG